MTALLPILLLLAAIAFIVLATTRLSMHPFLALLLAALGYGLFAGMEPVAVVEAINAGFGGTIGYIGIVILAGTVIGTFLERSGGALSLAEAVLRLTGRRNVPLTMGAVGYVVSMPVFCDSGYVLLSPLNKALSRRAGVPIAAGAVALSLGLYATHTMVPPTPGPVAAAGILEADLGTVILWGLLVALVALIAGWLFAVLVASRFELSGGSAPGTAALPDASADAATRPERAGDPALDPPLDPIGTQAGERPGATQAMLPIVVPIMLILLGSLAKYPGKPFGDGALAQWIGFAGQPAIALLVGVGLAFLLPRRWDNKLMSTSGWVGQSVVAAAGIIVITGAGGAFGKVLQGSGIADRLGELLQGVDLGLLLPFAIAAAIKTAQGSSTVAIITTAGIVAPLLGPLGLDGDTARALAVIAIGAGSMVVSHANDSYFWVVSQFSGMTVKQGYQLQTVGTLIEGIAAAAGVWVLGQVLIG